MTKIPHISFHGSHTGEFCAHAEPCRLEEIVRARIERGFTHFGLSEHQYVDRQEYVSIEDRQAGRSVEDVKDTFLRYMVEARRLQHKYENRANILVGFETEVYDDVSVQMVNHIRDTYEFDYIVGSVHFVNGVCYDANRQYYDMATKNAGGLENLYRNYYDLQFKLIRQCRPEVIGHFDLIKIFSPDNSVSRSVWDLIERNIKEAIGYGGVFEVNTRAFKKGLDEPYPGREILETISNMGGEITLGDDSHALEDIGYAFERVTDLLTDYFQYIVAFEKDTDGIKKIRLSA